MLLNLVSFGVGLLVWLFCRLVLGLLYWFVSLLF